jgi:hypothetical protein
LYKFCCTYIDKTLKNFNIGKIAMSY